MIRPCDLCGSTETTRLLECERLDGPLVRCHQCGLVYVGERLKDFTFAIVDKDKSRALAERVQALGLVDELVEAAEAPWRHKLFEDRLRRLQRFISAGRLLEIGCASGEFLRLAAHAGFDVEGIEPEPITSARARDSFGLNVMTGTLAEAAYPADSFDAVVLFHVLEHLDSPRQTVTEIHRILKPGGTLAIETPTIDTIWFRLLGSRWRQLIPDHYFFFTPHTLSRLLETVGFRVLEVKKVGKPMSIRLFLDRLRRFNSTLGKSLSSLAYLLGLENQTLHLTLGDVMLVAAQKTPSAVFADTRTA
ncbi:MAG: methyltransferase domain-containing protein [Acidobacteria bacterium]|nr:methyltransferase domain-containing protein [Acidobacteriota bacterium]